MILFLAGCITGAVLLWVTVNGIRWYRWEQLRK